MAAQGEDEDEYDYDDEYDWEYDDEYGDSGIEDGEEELAQAAKPKTIIDTTAPKASNPAARRPKLSEQEQNEADALLGQRYKKFAEAVKILASLKEKYPQFNLDGERNIWILKPAGSSRGRGICLKRDLCEILNLIRFKDANISNQKNGQLYIAQKYIENTMVIKCRKFDIRQWVIVTDWNPLTIWIYAEPYIRFPAADFDFDKISNRYAHLSNNSIAKYGSKQKITHHIEGNMWDLE